MEVERKGLRLQRGQWTVRVSTLVQGSHSVKSNHVCVHNPTFHMFSTYVPIGESTGDISFLPFPCASICMSVCVSFSCSGESKRNFTDPVGPVVQSTAESAETLPSRGYGQLLSLAYGRDLMCSMSYQGLSSICGGQPFPDHSHESPRSIFSSIFFLQLPPDPVLTALWKLVCVSLISVSWFFVVCLLLLFYLIYVFISVPFSHETVFFFSWKNSSFSVNGSSHS